VPVLDALNISIISEGTSHGSTSATDGSGVDVARSEPDPALFPDGQIVFTAATDPEQQHMRALLHDLRSTRKGRALHDLYARFSREAGYLIRNHKLVKVAWHRHKGPAFLAHVLNHLRGHSERVPREVDGVTAHTLLVKMAEVLMRHGSHELRRAIEEHYDEGLQLLGEQEVLSARDCIERLQKKEAAA
jgi:hypothetical protein